jgi:hypothetical protein
VRPVAGRAAARAASRAPSIDPRDDRPGPIREAAGSGGFVVSGVRRWGFGADLPMHALGSVAAPAARAFVAPVGCGRRAGPETGACALPVIDRCRARAGRPVPRHGKRASSCKRRAPRRDAHATC